MKLPGFLLRHTVVVEPYLGESGAGGPVFGTPVIVRCFLDDQLRQVLAPDGLTVISTATVYCRRDALAEPPPDSRVTLPDGRSARVIEVRDRDGGGLPTPDHMEVSLQ